MGTFFTISHKTVPVGQLFGTLSMQMLGRTYLLYRNPTAITGVDLD